MLRLRFSRIAKQAAPQGPDKKAAPLGSEERTRLERETVQGMLTEASSREGARRILRYVEAMKCRAPKLADMGRMGARLSLVSSIAELDA